MSDVVPALESLMTVLTEADMPVVRRLRPGLDDATIDRLCSAIPVRLPEDIRDMYRWHDGADAPAERPWEGRDLASEAAFWPLSDVVEAYTALIQNGVLADDGLIPLLPFGADVLFPVFPNGWELHTIRFAVCDDPDGVVARSGVLYVEDAEFVDVFDSMAEMFEAFEARWRSGIYERDEEDGGVLGSADSGRRFGR